MTAQMTEWYPPEVKPECSGKYETMVTRTPLRAYWNGCIWISALNGYVLRHQTRHWRGLAADPEVTK